MGIDYKKGSATDIDKQSKSCIEDANEKIIEILMVLFSDDFELNNFGKLLKDLSEEASFRIPYSQLTIYMNRLFDDDSSEENISNRKIDDAKQRLQMLSVAKEYGGDSKVGPIIIKLSDHIDLAENQFAVLEKRAIKVEQKIKEETREIGKDLMGTRNEVRSLQDSVYSQIISIVAIFTGIAFILFGGVSAVSGIKDAVCTSGTAFLRVIAYAFVIGSFVIGAVLLFFRFVLVLTSKNVNKDDWTIKFGQKAFYSMVILAFVLGVFSVLLDTYRFTLENWELSINRIVTEESAISLTKGSGDFL